MENLVVLKSESEGPPHPIFLDVLSARKAEAEKAMKDLFGVDCEIVEVRPQLGCFIIKGVDKRFSFYNHEDGYVWLSLFNRLKLSIKVKTFTYFLYRSKIILETEDDEMSRLALNSFISSSKLMPNFDAPVSKIEILSGTDKLRLSLESTEKGREIFRKDIARLDNISVWQIFFEDVLYVKIKIKNVTVE